MRSKSRLLLAALAVFPVLLASIPLAAQQAPLLRECAGNMSAKKLDREIDRLIEQMTPEERIAQLQDRAPAVPRSGICDISRGCPFDLNRRSCL